jgi:hypothetical protein
MAQFRTDQHKLDFTNNKTRHEVFMLSDRLSPSGTLTDAFGRLRVSDSLTLFDSQHRYQDNDKWATANTSGANTVYQSNQSAIDLNVGTTSGQSVYRETKRVFAYQPGKSLLVMNTFAMDTPKTNLRQRVGYFGTQNGIFLENDGVSSYIVLRSYVTGSVVETRVAQANWNIDKFDGTGYSSQTVGSEHSGGLDVTKTNILWMDIEWLGVGDVRVGFVVDGRLCVAHVFHNDNKNATTYITTACLPIRYEIENTGTTVSSSTMKQICSTVISEGGYQLSGTQRGVGIPIGTPKDIPTAGTFTPIISIRLKADRFDSIVVPNSVNFVGVTNNTTYRFKLVYNPILTGASWVDPGSDSSVEYDVSATSYTGGRDAKVGYLIVGAGMGSNVVDFKEGLFKFQLERNTFTNTAIVFSLVATGAANGNDALGSIEWEEIFH